MIKSRVVISLYRLLRFVVGGRRWLQVTLAVWLALLATVLLLVSMGQLAQVSVAHADGEDLRVVVTKTIEPPYPASGQMVVISFTLMGVGTPQVVTRSLDVALAIDVSGSMGWSTSPLLVTGTFATAAVWEPVYTFTVDYTINDSMRAFGTHPIRFVRHVEPPMYYTDTVDYDLQVSPAATGLWTVETLRAGGTEAYTVAVYLPEHRLPAATYASKLFIDAISDTDQAAIVPFSGTSRVAQSLTSNHAALHSALDQLRASGSTYIDKGISRAHNELIVSGNALSDSKRAIIVMSDGETDNPLVALSAAQKAAADGVIIYTVGFGEQVDANIMRAIADIGGGKYYFAPDSQALQQIYQQIAQDLRDTVAVSILIYDILPPGVTLVTDSLASGWSYEVVDGQTIVTRIITDPLRIDEVIVYTLPVRIDWPAGISGPVNGAGSGITMTTPASITTFTPFTNPVATTVNLVMDKQGPDYGFRGQPITYTLWLTNPGPVPFSEACLGDVLGPEATVVSASHGGQEVIVDGITAWVWDLGTVATNTVLSRTLVARVHDNVPEGALLRNVAGAGRVSQGTCFAPITGNLIISDTWAVTLTTGLEASKTSGDVNGPALYPDDTLLYTVTVVNAGTLLTHENVVIADNIPASTTFESGSFEGSDGAIINFTGAAVVARVNQLAPGEVFTLTFRAKVNSDTGGDIITNRARVASDQQPSPPQPLPTTDMVNASVPSLVLNKWADPDATDKGEDNPTYYYQIVNTSDVPLTVVQIYDDQFRSNWPASCQFFGSIAVDLQPDEVHTLTCQTPIAADTRNVATVTAQVPGFPGVVSATDDAYFDFIEAGGLDISLDLTVRPARIRTGQAVTYTYRLYNIGRDWLEGGIVTDTVKGAVNSGVSLAPGTSYTGVFTRWIATTTVNSVYAWGTDRLLSNTAIASDSVIVTVDPFGPPPIYLPIVLKNH